MRDLLAVRVVTTVLVVILSGALLGQVHDGGRGFPAKDWSLVGGDWSSSRHSTLNDITIDTVDRLGGAWVRQFDGGGSSRATPVVQNGILYLTAGASVFAIDGGTGETVWRWQAESSNAQRVPSWQGVGLGGGLVFVGLRSAEVAALRQDTGDLVWSESVGSVPRQVGEGVTTAPLYARGQVFVGLANGDAGGQGRIVALDASTGETQWTFFVVPRPGEFGHNTWPQDSDIWQLGGGGVWLNGTVDPDLGLVYFATGNPVPMFGGEIRKGDNLFTASVLALDMKTGERRWHYQVVRHDLWDADIAIPLLLYETEIDGRGRKALAAMRADGYLFVFDRETGEPLVPIEERPVPQDAFLHTAPTQPFPEGVESILPDCSFWRDAVPPPFELNCSGFTPPSIDQHTVVAPGVPIPLVRVAPMSYDPQTGYIYVQGRAMVGRARRFDDPWLQWAGGYQVTLPEPAAVVAAIDPRSGTVVWKHESRTARLGASGALTTAGGLMFRGATGGQVEAYDARTGAPVWSFQTGMPGGWRQPGPAAAYDVDGTQHLAIAMGRELWAFTLDGTVPEREAPASELTGQTSVAFGAALRPTNQIETSTLVESRFGTVGGKRQAIEEHAFSPIRARVGVGARVRFLNNGEIAHTVAARDGSWTTGTLEPARFSYVTFEEPGTLLYHCVDHPWAIGEVTVEPENP